MKEYQISAFGTYLYIGKSNTLVDGGSGNPVFMLQNNDTRTGKRIGLIHQYDLYGWIGLVIIKDLLIIQMTLIAIVYSSIKVL